MTTLTVDASEQSGDSASLFYDKFGPETSATGGCLAPGGYEEPLEDEELENFIQSWLVCLTGIDQTLVRPRWQPEPPNIPSESSTWLAFGITETETDLYAAIVHHPEHDGHDELREHETLTILTSFYGPQSRKLCARLRDGMKISQNREDLLAKSFDIVGPQNMVNIPELIKGKWIKRVDMPIILRRQIVRRYPVKNIKTGVFFTTTGNSNTITQVNE